MKREMLFSMKLLSGHSSNTAEKYHEFRKKSYLCIVAQCTETLHHATLSVSTSVELWTPTSWQDSFPIVCFEANIFKGKGTFESHLKQKMSDTLVWLLIHTMNNVCYCTDPFSLTWICYVAHRQMRHGK